MDTLSLDGVEIFAAGKWNGDEYSLDDLDSMVFAFDALGEHLKPPIKLGHNDEQRLLVADGLPSAGWISRLYRRGEKLLADIVEIPKKVADLIKAGAYRKRSAEIWWDYEDPATGETFPRVLCGLALLGADLPAVNTLDDILALYGGKHEGANLHAYIGELTVSDPSLHAETYAISGARNLPLAPKGRAWDGSAAEKRIFDWAGGDEFSPAKARRGFVYYDSSNPSVRASYKLPFADVISGQLTAVWSGVKAAMGAVNGARGGVKISDAERRRAHAFLVSYYHKFEMEPPDFRGDMSMVDETGKEKELPVQLEELKTFDMERMKLEKDHPAVSFDKEGGDEESYCGACRFYRGKYVMECSLVEGVVRHMDVCKLFQPDVSAVSMTASPESAERREVKTMTDPKEKKEQKVTEPPAQEAAEKGVVSDEATMRAEIEARVRKEYDEKLAAAQRAAAESGSKDEIERLRQEKAALESRVTTLEEDQSRASAESFIKELSTQDNMRITPALVPLATYLLHQAGRQQPKKYAAKEGEQAIEYREALKQFMLGLPNMSEFGLFDIQSKEVDESADVWTYDREMKDPTGAVQRRVEKYLKDHPNSSEEEALEMIEKSSPEGKALVKRYFAGRRAR